MIEIRNGAIRTASNRRRKTRKRNPSATTRAKRNPTISVAQARTVLAKNGISVKAVANPKRRKRSRRRNGVAVRSRNNGVFGNTKADVKKVLSLLGGAIGTNVIGNTGATLLSPYLAQLGVGGYAGVLSQAVVAVFGVPYVAKAVAGKDAADMARLGGLLSVALDVLGMLFPQFNQLNPFNTSAVIVNPSGQVTVTPAAAAQIAQAASAETAAKVAGYMRTLEGSGMGASSGNVETPDFGISLNATM